MGCCRARQRRHGVKDQRGAIRLCRFEAIVFEAVAADLTSAADVHIRDAAPASPTNGVRADRMAICEALSHF